MSDPVTEYDYSTLSDEDLAAEEAHLSDAKKAISAQQRALAAERELRVMLSTASSETRRIVLVRLGGETSPVGETAPKEVTK